MSIDKHVKLPRGLKAFPMCGGYWCVMNGDNLVEAWITKEQVRSNYL